MKQLRWIVGISFLGLIGTAEPVRAADTAKGAAAPVKRDQRLVAQLRGARPAAAVAATTEEKGAVSPGALTELDALLAPSAEDISEPIGVTSCSNEGICSDGLPEGSLYELSDGAQDSSDLTCGAGREALEEPPFFATK